MCSRDCLNLALLIIYGKRGVVVHLQAFLILLFLIHFPFLAALAAAAAAFPAKAHHPGDDAVPRFERVQWPGKEVPIAKHRIQGVWAVWLHDVHHHYEDHQHHHGYADPHQDLPAGDGQPQHSQGQNEETKDQIDKRKPAVFGCSVAQSFS